MGACKSFPPMAKIHDVRGGEINIDPHAAIPAAPLSSAAAGAFGEGNRGGGECSGKREGAAREEEERGDTRRRRGVAREAGGSRGWRAVAVHASARAHPPGRGGRRERRRRWWAGPLEELGQVSGRQVSGWASLFFLYICSVFYLIATEFKFKQI